MAPSFDSYVDALRRSGLLKPHVIDALLAEFAEESDHNPGDGEQLAARLVERNVLTEWQNGHLLAGRSRGFFLGNYKLLRMLGAGGMGAVYLAEHTFMQRLVAVKVLYEQQVDSTNLERFHIECRAIAALDHPNIVRAHDFDSDGEFLYLVMEYINGPDLQTLVHQSGPLPFSKAAACIRQAAEGLAHAHSKGMIHRDVKPANLLLDPRGILRILDLGLARLTNRNGKSLTAAAAGDAILGTVDFLAPEQAIDSHNVDHRADVYGLGCTFYYLLCGHAPFCEGTVAQRLMQHQIEPPPSVLLERPDTPAELVDLCMRMIAKKPEDRIQSAVNVSEAIRKWEAAAGVSNLKDVSASDTSINASQPTMALRTEPDKIHLRCHECRTVFRTTQDKADRVLHCPKCKGPLVRAEPPIG